MWFLTIRLHHRAFKTNKICSILSIQESWVLYYEAGFRVSELTLDETLGLQHSDGSTAVLI